MSRILQYVPDEDKAKLAEIDAALRQAKARILENERELAKAKDKIWSLAASQGRDAQEAVELFRAGKAPSARSGDSWSKADLETAIRGLQQEIDNDKAEKLRLIYARKLALETALKNAADAIAREYYPLAEKLGPLHAAIGGIETALHALSRRDAALVTVLDVGDWSRFYVPGSQSIPTLRDRGRLIEPQYKIHALAGGESRLLGLDYEREFNELQAALAGMLEGRNPFAPET